MSFLVLLQLSKKLLNFILEKKAINICQAMLMHTFFFTSHSCVESLTRWLIFQLQSLPLLLKFTEKQNTSNEWLLNWNIVLTEKYLQHICCYKCEHSLKLSGKYLLVDMVLIGMTGGRAGRAEDAMMLFSVGVTRMDRIRNQYIRRTAQFEMVWRCR